MLKGQISWEGNRMKTRRALGRAHTSATQCLIHKNISGPTHFSNIMLYIVFGPITQWWRITEKIVVSRSWSSPKSNQFLLVTHATSPQNFIRIRPQLFKISCTQTDRQTNKQTNKWNVVHSTILGKNHPKVGHWPLFVNITSYCITTWVGSRKWVYFYPTTNRYRDMLHFVNSHVKG